MHPEDPVRLGNYHVVRRLREVPIGITLLGTDQTGRAVVLTVVDSGLAARDGFRERFAREAKAAATAPPAFVSSVLDLDVAAEAPWLATVAATGPSLTEFVRDRGPLGDPGTAALARRLADGLAALHAAGLVHGDLGPDAIVLAEEGPRLVGYGLARAAGPDYGTPGYQAPEQAGAPDGSTNPAVDVFALGAVLGFAATGRSPFAAADPAAIHWRAATTGPTEPDLGPLGEPVRSVVLACLRPDPAQRPTAAQVAAQLAAQVPAQAGAAADPTVVVPTPGRGEPTATLVGAPPGGPGGPTPGAAWGHSLHEPPRHEPQRYGPPQYGPPPAAPGTDRRRGPVIALVALAVVVVLALVAGVALLVARGTFSTAASPTGVASSDAAPPVAPPAGSTAGPTASSSAVTKENVDPGTGATLVDLGPFGADSPRFTTPSRNIACQLSDTSAAGAGQARCDVAQRTWQVPAAPADCPGAFGTGAQVSGADQGTLTCVSDTVADPGLQVLPYGQALSFGGIVCDSQETGVRCVNPATGHGFRVARASYDLF